MAKLSSNWEHAFMYCFHTEEEVVEFIFENINTTGWEDSYSDLAGFGEPNEMAKTTKEDKKQLLYDFMMEFVKPE